MNNKLYKKYLSLKIENPDIAYLFKAQNNYFFIANDAIKMSKLLGLELINLNSVIFKCEFSETSYNLYLKKLDENNIIIKIINLSEDVFNYELEKYFCSNEYNELLSNFLQIDINSLSISQAYDLLNDLQKRISDFTTSS